MTIRHSDLTGDKKNLKDEELFHRFKYTSTAFEGPQLHKKYKHR